MNKKFITTVLIAASFILGSSCKQMDEVLDRKPLDKVGPEVYYNSADQLRSFTINRYSSFWSPQGQWFSGIFDRDNNTDNAAYFQSPQRALFSKEYWKVPTNGGLGINSIRDVNWFLEQVLPKFEANKISGDQTEVKQCVGEAYFFRAFYYFGKLKTYGDYPILRKVLSDDEKELKEAAKRMPRNEVARFILGDLNKAIELLRDANPSKQRINKSVARLFKSRVALYEGTFEKYHKGSGRVPGDSEWPGANKEWNKGKSFNIDAEVEFFLQEAKKEAKLVADANQLAVSSHQIDPTAGNPNGWNPYYDMFASIDPSGNSEVLLWKQFNKELNTLHLTAHRYRRGTGIGFTRGLIQAFLMKNGKPIYDTSSGYGNDESIDNAKKDRDERLQLFVIGESTPLSVVPNENGELPTLGKARLIGKKDNVDATGYCPRKGFNYDPNMDTGDNMNDITAYVIFRSSEAYLNYIEASYLLSGSLDGDATKYWTALRERAGITAPIQETIDATMMDYEADATRPSYDWAAFSAGKAIDATLYSIRRERRCELASEGFRWDDLHRWRAMDQVKNYQIEGVNFWDKMYEKYDIAGKDNGSSESVVSAKALSKYFRPFQIIKENNDMYDGYTFYQAHYLTGSL